MAFVWTVGNGGSLYLRSAYCIRFARIYHVDIYAK